MIAFILIRALGMLLVLVAFGRPRSVGRHRIDITGHEFTGTDGELVEAAALPHEKRVYVTIQGDFGDAIAGLRPAQARQLAAALVREASLAA